MATALVLSGVYHFALLIGDICCVPVQKGNDPATYGDRYRSGFGPQPTARSGHETPPSYGQVPRSSKLTDTGSVQSSGHGPAAYSGSGPSGQGFDSMPAAYSAQYSPRGGAPKDAALPLYDPAPGPSRPMNAAPAQPSGWYVQPALPDGVHDEQLPPEGLVFGGSEYVGPLIPKPVYQAGELSHYEDTAEGGFYESESEEEGSPPPPPPFPVLAPPEAGLTSVLGPKLPYWDVYPYYYDYMFLTGQYPSGTYAHATTSFEHGHNGWNDVRYLRENIPYQAEPVQESGTSMYSAASQPGKVSTGQ